MRVSIMFLHISVYHVHLSEEGIRFISSLRIYWESVSWTEDISKPTMLPQIHLIS